MHRKTLELEMIFMLISTLGSKARNEKMTCSRSHGLETTGLELESETLCFSSFIAGVTFNVCSWLKLHEILILLCTVAAPLPSTHWSLFTSLHPLSITLGPTSTISCLEFQVLPRWSLNCYLLLSIPLYAHEAQWPFPSVYHSMLFPCLKSTNCVLNVARVTPTRPLSSDPCPLSYPLHSCLQ